jgi:hypothetical protein
MSYSGKRSDLSYGNCVTAFGPCERLRVGLLIRGFLLVIAVSSLPFASSIAEEMPVIQGLTAISEQTFQQDFEMVWNVVLAVLAERNESINTLKKKEGLILASQTIVNRERLQKIALTRGQNFERGGWYTLTIHVAKLTEFETKVTLEVFIIGTVVEMDNIWGGMPLHSSGTLEMEIFAAATRRLQG